MSHPDPQPGLVVIAMGGHSLLDPALPPTVQNQFAVTARAMGPVADLVERGRKLVLTHGNGPQVGFMQLRSELSKAKIHEVPLDSLVADSQGAIGYMIQRALRQELMARDAEREVATIVTEVEVDHHDTAFTEPTKPIGRFYTEQEAAQLAADHGWRMAEDPKRGWRRVVASPSPVSILELPTIRMLAEAGTTVISCGGGGIPVTREDDGTLLGVEAVIDKDRTSALLAVALGATHLVITTAVDAVYKDFLSDTPVRLTETDVETLKDLEAEGQFPKGSMGPKIEAAVYFLERGGQAVVICAPEDLVDALEGKAGTTIRLHAAEQVA